MIWRFGFIPAKPAQSVKWRSLNPTVECLERRHKRTGQTVAEMFPRPTDLIQYLELVSDRKKMYLYFAEYFNHKKYNL
jgi:hypothetical protein